MFLHPANKGRELMEVMSKVKVVSGIDLEKVAYGVIVDFTQTLVKVFFEVNNTTTHFYPAELNVVEEDEYDEWKGKFTK